MSNTRKKLTKNALLKILQDQYMNKNDPKLLSKCAFEDLLPISDNLKFLYFNQESVDKILYLSEELIEIKSKKLHDLFYLNLLIKSHLSIINYKYSIEYIKEINNNQLEEKNEFLKIIFAKIIFDLIYNYRGFNENEEINI